jgi:hypothetical protein
MITISGTADTIALWGFIPDFLDEGDPRPAREQFNERYRGGWVPAPPGLKLDVSTLRLTYPGDPAMVPLSTMYFRDEVIVLFRSSWVCIIQPDRSWEVARMD